MLFLSSEEAAAAAGGPRFSLLCLTLATWHRECFPTSLWLYLTRATGEEPKGKKKKVVCVVMDGVSPLAVVFGRANQIRTEDAETYSTVG